MPVHLWPFLLWTITCISFSRANPYPTFGTRLRPPNSNAGSCTNCYRTKLSELQVLPEPKHQQSPKLTNIDPTLKEHTPLIKKHFQTAKPLVKTQQTSSPIYSELPKDNPKHGATFFFTQVEPHRFEYRAMYQHPESKDFFSPFVHDFEGFGKEFPPLPKFPSLPDFPEIFSDFKSNFPNLNEYSFQPLSPIKRAWQPHNEINPQRHALNENIENPLLKQFENPLLKEFESPLLKNLESPLSNKLDRFLRHTDYPKIFKFNDERINIEDFDRKKKLRFYSLGKNAQNALLEPDNVKRDQLLILHGGIFTVQEPPLYSNHIKRRRRKSNSYSSRTKFVTQNL